MKLRFRLVLFLALLTQILSITRAGAQTTVAPVAAAALQKLLPTIDGWTNGAVRADKVDMSADAVYTFASVTLTKADSRVKLQLSDSATSADTLSALASIVTSMPSDFAGNVGGSSIKRFQAGD